MDAASAAWSGNDSGVRSPSDLPATVPRPHDDRRAPHRARGRCRSRPVGPCRDCDPAPRGAPASAWARTEPRCGARPRGGVRARIRRPPGRRGPHASTEAFRDSGTRYLDAARGQLETTVAPLRQSLEDVGPRPGARPGARAGVRRAAAAGRVLSERTGSLANALRSPNVRGRWGEAQLATSSSSPACSSTATSSSRRRHATATATSCGPTWSCASPAGSRSSSTPRCRSRRTSRRSRPRTRRSAGAARRSRAPGARPHDEAGREGVLAAVRARARLRRHVRARRDAAPRRARARPALAEDAWSNGVVLASPSTLMALLRTVAAVWQQETVAESARQVHELGRELYKRLATLGAHLAKLGRSLDGAVGVQRGRRLARVACPRRRRAGSRSTGSRGEPRELQPRSSGQTRSLGAERRTTAARDRLPGDAHARVSGGTPGAAIPFPTVKGRLRTEEHWTDRD